MFKTLSTNEAVPRGKKVSEQSQNNQKSNFTVKDPDYQDKNYQSVSSYFHDQKNRIPNNINMGHPNTSHFELAQTDSINPNRHYLSETKAKFGQPQNPQKAKQVREKTELLKTTYSLGEEKSGYSTTNAEQFYDKSSIRVSDIRTKQPERYNIVTNKDLPSQMVTNASAFDFWNQDKSKNRTSNNLTDHPMYGVKIDPITNRVLPTSKRMPPPF